MVKTYYFAVNQEVVVGIKYKNMSGSKTFDCEMFLLL